MREVHLYIADDGTEFEDEKDCLRHEAGCRAFELKGQVVFLDAEFCPIPLSDLGQWEDAWFIYAKDIQALRVLSDIWDWDLVGACPPNFLNGDTAGLFVYDEDHDSWYHMSNRIQSLQAIAGRAMKVVNKNL